MKKYEVQPGNEAFLRSTPDDEPRHCQNCNDPVDPEVIGSDAAIVFCCDACEGIFKHAQHRESPRPDPVPAAVKAFFELGGAKTSTDEEVHAALHGERCHACDEHHPEVGDGMTNLPMCKRCKKAWNMGYRCAENAPVFDDEPVCEHPMDRRRDERNSMWCAVCGACWYRDNPASFSDGRWHAPDIGQRSEAQRHDCAVEVYSSRMCERGTKSCTVVHGMSSDSSPMTGPGVVTALACLLGVAYREDVSDEAGDLIKEYVADAKAAHERCLRGECLHAKGPAK